MPRTEGDLLARARSGHAEAFGDLAEPHRRELHLHCYRMLGSILDAEDVVQETLLRAWRRLDTYEGRAPFRAWLYRIATNACLDAASRRPRRATAPSAGPPANPDDPAAPAVEHVWIEPCPDLLLDLVDSAPGPEARYTEREGVEIAFLAAIQYLSPRQRAVLLLRDVLGWRAREVADLLGTSAASVNSLLQRAHETLDRRLPHDWSTAHRPTKADEAALLARYLSAWEEADLDALVTLLREDASMAMPPTPSWYSGREAIVRWLGQYVFGIRQLRLVPTRANGRPAFGVYHREGNSFHPLAIQVLTLDGHQVAAIDGFVNPRLFPFFGLLAELPVCPRPRASLSVCASARLWSAGQTPARAEPPR